jgi:hypothetical protein
VKAQQLLHDRTASLQGHKQPRLGLNDHGRLWRSQQQCQAEATHLDALSLWHRMSERASQRSHRTGILTVRQLSSTFRCRKRGKRVKARGSPHSGPLQAVALREHRVLLVSKPAVPEASPQLSVDLEGNPSGRLGYLIGGRIAAHGSTRHQAFGAERREDAAHLFQPFLHARAPCSDAHLFYDGSDEAQVFRRRLASGAPDTSRAGLWTRATNVLALRYANIYFPTSSNARQAIGH